MDYGTGKQPENHIRFLVFLRSKFQDTDKTMENARSIRLFPACKRKNSTQVICNLSSFSTNKEVVRYALFRQPAGQADGGLYAA